MNRRPRTRWTAILLLLAAAQGVGAPVAGPAGLEGASRAQAAPAASPPPADPAMIQLQAAIDAQVLAGFDQPGMALAALDALDSMPTVVPTTRRMLLLAHGLVAGAAGRNDQASEIERRLTQMDSDPLAAADAELVRATRADNRGETDPALRAAGAALQVYRRECPARPGCDYRSSVRALHLMARHQSRRGQHTAALEDALVAVQLARSAGDRMREALSLALAADVSGMQGDLPAAQRLLDEGLRVARTLGMAILDARMQVYVLSDAERRGDMVAARQAGETGLLFARRAGSQRLLAQLRGDLADILVKTGQPRAALQQTELGLPVAQRFGDQRIERMLKHNAALAQVALGMSAPARRTLDEVLAALHANGALAIEAETLREFADALAAAGDLKGALELFHRERQLTADILAANRSATLAMLRARNDQEAQQRQLEQLRRDNNLISLQLENRIASQRVWLGSGAILVLVMALVVLLYRRVRVLNQRLAHNQAYLRGQSQRDPLTGLYNRRRLAELSMAGGSEQAFTGVLLLVDVDHFKRVNDNHGHAAGDLVLVELARRLSEVAREQDLVLRWGGEEFLIYLPGADVQQAHDLAGRILEVVGAAMIRLPDGSALRVTASIGYGAFPLPSGQLPLSLERAINLADMALYTAKREGRNRAIGVESVSVGDAAGLERIEADFDQSLQEGLVSLRRTQGPVAPLTIVPGGTRATAA